MKKYVSIITNTFSSEISYNEWCKRTEEFFFSDDKIVVLLRQLGMTKWTIYKTDETEPVKAIIIFEYKTEESFKKCQKIFLKFMPELKDMIMKTNIVRAKTVFDKI